MIRLHDHTYHQLKEELFHTVNRLAEEEVALYRSLGELVDFEEERVRDADMEGLLSVLRQKQRIISRQEALFERWNEVSVSLGIEEVREGSMFWNTLSRRVGRSGYNQIADRIDEIRELGQKLLDRERKIRQNLGRKRAEMWQAFLEERCGASLICEERVR